MRKCWFVSFCFLVTVLMGSQVFASFTVGTFDDPALDGSTPLFALDLVNDQITGGWDDSKTGLMLILPFVPATYADAYFTMAPVAYTGGLSGGTTGSGTIKFFADGTTGTPVFQIDFDQAHINVSNLSGNDIEGFSADGVTFSGSAIPAGLNSESFSFSFSNQTPIDDQGGIIGFTATASFTSSAVPEPATLIVLALGSLFLVRKK